MSEHAIPLVVPSYQNSFAVNFFEVIRADLIPEFVDPMVISPTGGISTILTSSALLSLFLTVPFGVYEGVCYISPALYEGEKNTIKKILIPATLLFFGGVGFAYFVFLPVAYEFLYNWGIWLGVETKLTLGNMINFTGSIMIMMGLAWELPVVMAGLSKVKLVKHESFLEHKKKIIFAIFVLGAILTPADFATMLFFSLPLVLLYFLGIYVSRKVNGGDS